MSAASDPFIYLLMSPADYDRAVMEGTWAPASLVSEGFIHASPASQLTRVANKHYRQHDELRVVSLRVERITAEVRWEPAAGSLYPHVYGPLNMDAVERVVPATKDPEGQFVIDLASHPAP